MKKKELILAWTRDFTLTWAEWWSRDMHPRLVEVFGKGIPNQLSYYNGRLLETYRLKKEAESFIDAVIKAGDKQGVLEAAKIKRYTHLIKKIRASIPNENNSTDPRIFESIKAMSKEMYPWYTVSYLLPQERWSKKLIRKNPKKAHIILARLVKARVVSEGTIEYLVEYWRTMGRKLLIARKISPKYASFITYGELEKMLYDKKYYPEIKQLKARSKHYIFLKDRVDTGISFEVFLKKRGLIYHPKIIDRSALGLKGLIACSGPSSVKGRVSIILRNEELVNFKKGNILVTVMTNPYFIPIMKKAKAIITDEGGVTCHAAIVSRELGVPCVIGTKTATQMLKDGDLVEVDATRGIVTKI